MAASKGSNTKARVAELHTAGFSNSEIARELGVKRSTVSYHLRTLGHPPDLRFTRRYSWAEVQAFHDEGHTARECFLTFGMSPKSWHDARLRGDLVTRPAAMPIEALLTGPRNRNHIKQRLIKAGLKSQICEICGLAEWMGEPLSLELHHMNGDKHDNCLENLQILCPNCHSQTDTWGGRNRRVAGP